MLTQRGKGSLLVVKKRTSKGRLLWAEEEEGSGMMKVYSSYSTLVVQVMVTIAPSSRQMNTRFFISRYFVVVPVPLSIRE